MKAALQNFGLKQSAVEHSAMQSNIRGILCNLTPMTLFFKCNLTKKIYKMKYKSDIFIQTNINDTFLTQSNVNGIFLCIRSWDIFLCSLTLMEIFYTL